MKIFDVKELKLSDFVPGETSWPEETLCQLNQPTFYITEYASMACFGILLAAPRQSIICVAPSSSNNKHSLFPPEPIQGGRLQLAWLDSIQHSKEMAKKLKSDLKLAGLDKQRLRSGLLPYEGGACVGAPPIGVSLKLSCLSEYLFRVYLIPAKQKALDQFIDEFEELAQSLGTAFIRPVTEGDLSGNNFPMLIMSGCEMDKTYSQDAVFYTNSGQMAGELRTEQTLARSIFMESFLLDTIKKIESGEKLSFLESNPFLVDGAVRLPIGVLDEHFSFLCTGMVSVPNNSAQQIIDHKYVELMDRVSSCRARLIRLLGWPVFFLGAHRALVKMSNRYLSPPADLPFDTESELRIYLDNIRKMHPIISGFFLENIWS